MIFDSRKVLLLSLIAAALVLPSSSALANCQAAMDRHNKQVVESDRWYVQEFRKLFGVAPNQMDWSKPEVFCPKLVPLERAYIPRVQQGIATFNAAKSACPKLGTHSSGVAGLSGGHNSSEAVLKQTLGAIEECERIIGKIPQVAEKPAAPASAPKSEQEALLDELGKKGPELRPPAQPSVAQTQGSPQCGSDITGKNLKPSDRAKCPSSAGLRFSCDPPGTAKQCLDRAGHTNQKPYNGGNKPLVFYPFSGPPVILPKDYSLWSIPPAPGEQERTLEARKWDGSQKDPTKPCDHEYAEARISPFIVRTDCEMKRQDDLLREFENREDGYLDSSDCKGSKVMADGANSRDYDWWKANPRTPAYYCETKELYDPSRIDRVMMREPNWSTEKRCKEQGDIFGKKYPITINARGVRGCKMD